MPGLIAMLSVFVVVGIEMFFATRGAGHVHGSEYDRLPSARLSGTFPRESTSSAAQRHRRLASLRDLEIPGPELLDDDDEAITLPRAQEAARTRPHGDNAIARNFIRPLANRGSNETDNDESDRELGELNGHAHTGPNASLLNGCAPVAREDTDDHANHDKHQQGSLTEKQQQQRQLLQCLLLEAGILFHSVFIGMALSVAVGTPFVVLLVAISFHQAFEGLALGSRIAAINFPPRSPKPWLMALAYGVTTPVGQAIGLAIHTLYDPASQTGLLTVGMMNAISSGLLLFAGLVELLAEDFLSNESYVNLTGRRRLEACASVVAGAVLMAIVGAWA